MLRLTPLNPVKTVFHSDSGASFTIDKLSPKDYSALRKAAMKGGEVDSVALAEKAAVKIIRSWERVEGECTNETKARFGAAFAFNIVPWLIDQAMELEDHVVREEAEGKGS